MELTSLFEILKAGGPVAMAAIFAYIWYLERKERQEAQRSLLSLSTSMIKSLTKFEGVLDKIVAKHFE